MIKENVKTNTAQLCLTLHGVIQIAKVIHLNSMLFILILNANVRNKIRLHQNNTCSKVVDERNNLQKSFKEPKQLGINLFSPLSM